MCFWICIIYGLKWFHLACFSLGQPKRHLLTTGWSVFVSAKRLVAGDSVLFIWLVIFWSRGHFLCKDKVSATFMSGQQLSLLCSPLIFGMSELTFDLWYLYGWLVCFLESRCVPLCWVDIYVSPLFWYSLFGAFSLFFYARDLRCGCYW